MSETVINLIIQLIAGIIGDDAAGSAVKNAYLGGAGAMITGGGIRRGQLLPVLIPAQGLDTHAEIHRNKSEYGEHHAQSRFDV